jgi:hypothetical protein
MRRFAVLLCLVCAVPSFGQTRKAKFAVLPNLELYSQKTPKEALDSVLNAIQRDRVDYIVAHLLDPAFVQSRIDATQAYYEKVAGQEFAAAGASLTSKELIDKSRDRAATLGYERLKRDISAKLLEEPDNIRDLKKFLRDGEVVESGDTAIITLKDVKDRAIYFKRIDGHWYMENRREEGSKPVPAKE